MDFITEPIARFAPSKFSILILLLCLQNVQLEAQKLYFEREWIDIPSEHMGMNLRTELCIPFDVLTAKNDLKLPLILMFDRQNEQTFEYNLLSINYASIYGAQMPPCLVAGIEFENQLRWPHTSLDAQYDVNMRNTELYLFEELIPAIKQRFPGINSIILIGHSRTAYLVNYLTANRYMDFDVAIACSGFFEEKETESFYRDIPFERLMQRERPFRYYMSSGDGFEEEHYKKENERIAHYLKMQGNSDLFEWKMKVNPYANHMTNYTLTVPWALIDVFSDFGLVLSDRFEDDFKEDIQADQGKAYFKDLNELYLPIDPVVLHLNSIISHFVVNEMPDKAMEFINIAIKTYPKDPGFMLFKVEMLLELGMKSEAEQAFEVYAKLMKASVVSDPDYLLELQDWEEQLRSMIKE